MASSNATMIVGARSNYALGLDWPIVSFMSRWDRKRDVPVAAFLVQGAINAALVAFAAYEQNQLRTIVEFTAPVFWFFFLLTGISLFVLRKKLRACGASVPGALILCSADFVGTCGFLFWSSFWYAQSQHALQVAAGVMAVGLVLWIIARLKGK